MLTIQTVFIIAISYVASKLLKLNHDIAAPAGMIGAATTVGVLTEVPVMLALCSFANKTKGWFQ